MGANPNCKGVGMVATVDAIAADRARFEPHLRPELRRYFDKRPVAARWYPAEDLVGLLDALLAGDPMPKLTRQQAFELYGAVGARRDVNADQTNVPARRRTELVGAYEGALNRKTDLPTTLRRLQALWQLYWDEGEHVAERIGPCTLRLRMVGCAPSTPEPCWLHTGFFKEAFKLIDVAAEVEHTACTATGAPECTWRFRLDVAPEVLAGFPAASSA